MENGIIRSRQNRLVKLVCALDRKKEREATGLFKFDGVKLCYEAIVKGVGIEHIFVCESKLDAVCQRLEDVAKKITFTVVSDDVFSKMSDEKSPEGIITVAKALDKLHKIATINIEGEFLSLPSAAERVMMLEAVRDPGNLGTVIRTAASLGMDRIVLSSDCADIYNPKTIRGAMGALFAQKIDVLGEGDTERYIGALRENGRRVLAAALRSDAQRLGKVELHPTDVFVIGNEGHGLSAGVIEACDGCVIIPMREGCESLNAAMAAGILIWETVRIR